MKKKTFIVQLLDSKNPNRKSFTQVEDANFYSNDTDASLVFIPHEDSFDFQSAKVVMYNRGDESLVERDMEVTTEDGRKVASYEMPDEIISHWGEWTAQPVFISGGEIYSGSIVPFSVFRYLMHERPPRLNEVVTITKFIQQSQALVDDMVQKEAQRVTQEQVRQSAEAVRVQAENERSEKYGTYSQQFNDVITELSEEKDYHSLPEISAARGGHDTLGQRLDETTAQLANTVKKGQVSINDININLGKITPNMVSDELLAQIAGDAAVNAVPADGSLTTAKYADKSVTEDKTNFINYSVNLFNKDTVHKEIGGYYAGPDFIEKANMDTYFVRVRPGMTITTNTSPVNNISFWDESFNYLEYISYSQTMSAPDNNDIVWASIPALTSLNVDEIMVVEGESLPTTYIPFKHTLSNYIGLSSGALEPLVDKGSVSKNIFNKDTVIIGYEVNGVDSQVTVQGDSAVSANINVEGMSSIYISGLPTYNIGGSNSLGRDRYYAFYDENGVPIVGSLGLIPRSITEQVISVPDNAKEFAFTVYQRKTTPDPVDVSTIMVEEGRTKSKFEPYKLGMVGIAGYRFETGTTADETLPTEGKTGLFFGDSITQTAVVSDDGVEYDEGRRSNWPKFAYDILKLGDMWNYAQSGASFKDKSLEPRQYLGHQVDTAISNDRPADIIVVSCGTNDGAEAIGDYDIAMSKSSLSELDVTNLYESIRYSFWKLRTFYPNATMYAALPIQRVAREQPEELIEAITKMAHRYNFIIIDGLRESGIVRDFEISGGNGRYLEDGLHPNVDGQIKMAKLYSRVIKNTYVE